MFKYLPLLWANLGRKRLRTSLTLASIIVAFLLFGLMQTLRVALTGSPELAGVDRLMTMHKVSIVQSMPLAYLNRIRGVAGVTAATSQDWFGGIFQEDRNQLPTFAVEVPTFLQVYGEYQLKPEEKEAFLKDRTSAIVGPLVAKRFGWKVGDTIPLRSNIWTKKDGGNTWSMKIAGIYQAANGDNQSIYFHYDYLNEARAEIKDMIGWVVVNSMAGFPRRSDGMAASRIGGIVPAWSVACRHRALTAIKRMRIASFDDGACRALTSLCLFSRWRQKQVAANHLKPNHP